MFANKTKNSKLIRRGGQNSKLSFKRSLVVGFLIFSGIVILGFLTVQYWNDFYFFRAEVTAVVNSSEQYLQEIKIIYKQAQTEATEGKSLVQEIQSKAESGGYQTEALQLANSARTQSQKAQSVVLLLEKLVSQAEQAVQQNGEVSLQTALSAAERYGQSVTAILYNLKQFAQQADVREASDILQSLYQELTTANQELKLAASEAEALAKKTSLAQTAWTNIKTLRERMNTLLAQAQQLIITGQNAAAQGDDESLQKAQTQLQQAVSSAQSIVEDVNTNLTQARQQAGVSVEIQSSLTQGKKLISEMGQYAQFIQKYADKANLYTSDFAREYVAEVNKIYEKSKTSLNEAETLLAEIATVRQVSDATAKIAVLREQLVTFQEWELAAKANLNQAVLAEQNQASQLEVAAASVYVRQIEESVQTMGQYNTAVQSLYQQAQQVDAQDQSTLNALSKVQGYLSQIQNNYKEILNQQTLAKNAATQGNKLSAKQAALTVQNLLSQSKQLVQAAETAVQNVESSSGLSQAEEYYQAAINARDQINEYLQQAKQLAQQQPSTVAQTWVADFQEIFAEARDKTIQAKNVWAYAQTAANSADQSILQTRTQELYDIANSVYQDYQEAQQMILAMELELADIKEQEEEILADDDLLHSAAQDVVDNIAEDTTNNSEIETNASEDLARSQMQAKMAGYLTSLANYEEEIQTALNQTAQFENAIGDDSRAQNALTNIATIETQYNELAEQISEDEDVVQAESDLNQVSSAFNRIEQNVRQIQTLAEQVQTEALVVEAASYATQLEEKYWDVADELELAQEVEEEVRALAQYSAELKQLERRALAAGSQLRTIVEEIEQNLEQAKNSVAAGEPLVAQQKLTQVDSLIISSSEELQKLTQIQTEAEIQKTELESEPDYYLSLSDDYFMQIDEMANFIEDGDGESDGAINYYSEVLAELEESVKTVDNTILKLKAAEQEAQKKNISNLNPQLIKDRKKAEEGQAELAILETELQKGLADMKKYANEIKAYQSAADKYKVKIESAAEFKDMEALQDNLQALEDALKGTKENYNLAESLGNDLDEEKLKIDEANRIVEEFSLELTYCEDDSQCDDPNLQSCDGGGCIVRTTQQGTIFKGQGTQQGLEAAREGLAGSNISTSDNVILVILGWVNFSLTFAGLIAFVGIVYAGFLYVANFGNEEQTGNAKNIIMWCVIGLVVIFSAYAIVSTIINAAS